MTVEGRVLRTVMRTFPELLGRAVILRKVKFRGSHL